MLAKEDDVPETSGKERAEAWVRERSQSTTGGRLYLSENDMVSLAALLDGPPKPHEVPYAVEQKRQRVLSALWRVAEASRVLQANVGRTTGPMWDAPDRSLYALDHDREAH